jgi:hypothetical protein
VVHVYERGVCAAGAGCGTCGAAEGARRHHLKVVNESDGAPIKGATIETVGEPHVNATTGADGKGRLDVPPGTYSVKASAEKFSPVTIQKLNVTVGKAVGSTAKLRAKEEATTQSKQTVEVTGVVKEASEATQLQQRKERRRSATASATKRSPRRPTRAPPRW